MAFEIRMRWPWWQRPVVWLKHRRWKRRNGLTDLGKSVDRLRETFEKMGR